MEIRIDTSRDSKDDIRKAIRLLRSLAGDGIEGGGSADQGFPSGENVLGGFFDTPDSASSSQQGPSTTQVVDMPETTTEKKETKSRKFSIGSSGGFDVY
jgi:hypothetical protein